MGGGASCHHRRNSLPQASRAVWSVTWDVNAKQKEALRLLVPAPPRVAMCCGLFVSPDLATILTETPQ